MEETVAIPTDAHAAGDGSLRECGGQNVETESHPECPDDTYDLLQVNRAQSNASSNFQVFPQEDTDSGKSDCEELGHKGWSSDGSFSGECQDRSTGCTDLGNHFSIREGRPYFVDLSSSPRPSCNSSPAHAFPNVRASARRHSLGTATTEEKAEVVAKLAELTTFDGEDELLRATGLNILMHGCARLFHNSVGTAATYELSATASRLDVFVSHNWSVKARSKFVALALYFNFRSACACSLLAVATTSALSIANMIPELDFGFSNGRFNIAGRVVCIPMFLLAILFAHEFFHAIGIKGKRAFLDKTCIHQEDIELQHRCLLKLAAYLGRSNRMVVLYSDVYLKKL